MALFIENKISIQSSKEATWDVLTNPFKTPQYMFGCTALSDWEEGSSLIWKGVNDGIIYVKGHIVKIIHGEKLSMTIFDPNAGYEDIPENYLVATYTLTQEDPDTICLHVIQGDYDTVADGQKRYEDTLKAGGWAFVLQNIKRLVEEA